MRIHIKTFASLREQLGVGELDIHCQEGANVASAWQQVCNEPLPEHILCAVNFQYVKADHPLQAGDEVAFFPPVTGG